MNRRYHEVKVARLSEERFREFGEIIEPKPDMPVKFEAPGAFKFWDNVVDPKTVNLEFGYLEAYYSPLEFSILERHVKTAELVIPLTGCSVLPLAPPRDLDKPDAEPELDEVVAFLLDGTKAVSLYPGTWHYAPMALSDKCTFLIGIRKGTTSDDMNVVDFKEKGIVFRITKLRL